MSRSRVQDGVHTFLTIVEFADILVKLSVNWQLLKELPHRLKDFLVAFSKELEQKVKVLLVTRHDELRMDVFVIRLIW